MYLLSKILDLNLLRQCYGVGLEIPNGSGGGGVGVNREIVKTCHRKLNNE